jgi:hypothetical protein
VEKNFLYFPDYFHFGVEEESVPGDGNFDDLVRSKISPSRLGVTGGEEGEGDK